MRRIVLNTVVWKYQVGKKNVVIIDPHGNKLVVASHILKGVTPDTFERGQWKRTSDGMVTPSEIRKYIESLG
jgi:hypothetical protein